MKNIFFAATLLIAAQVTFAQENFIFPTDADHPKLAAAGKTPGDFVPKSWEILQKTYGDLNGDKQEDCVIVMNGKYGKFIQKNDGFGTDPFDTNPHILAVLFKEKDGYKLVLQNNKIAAVAENPSASYPFSDMEIKNGVLTINTSHWMSAGGWGTSNTSFKFKYTKGEFAMIGADKNEFMRNSGEGSERSYNFLTRKVKVLTGNMMEYDTRKMKTTWRTLPAKFKPRTLANMGKPGEWEIERDIYL